MGQRSNDAAVTDVLMEQSKEEYVLSMGQNRVSNIAAVKDAQIKSSVGECVEGTGHIAIHTMNLLLLDENTRTLPQLKPYPISVLLELPSEDKKEEAFPKR
jgi:hypothetical protein